MTEFTFRFYGNDKHLTTKTFHTETIEDAYKKADDVLSSNSKYDDWEALPPKTNDVAFGANNTIRETNLLNYSPQILK